MDTEANAAVKAAVNAWDKAPMHIKAMAGAYMKPILHALQALERAIGEGRNGNGT